LHARLLTAYFCAAASSLADREAAGLGNGCAAADIPELTVYRNARSQRINLKLGALVRCGLGCSSADGCVFA